MSAARAARRAALRAMSAFITGTFEQLTEPTEQSARPRTEMCTSRYRHFPDNYSWLGAVLVSPAK